MTQISIVAIHGNGGGGFRFSRAAPFFPDAVKFSAPTLPGFAERRKDSSYKTVSDYARAIKDIAEREPRPRILLGHGIGGTLGLQMCKDSPGTVDGIIVHSPVGAFLDRRLLPKIMILPGVARIGRLIFTSGLTRSYFTSKLFKHPVPADYVSEFFREYERCSVFEDMFHIINHEWYTTLGQIDVKACILWGQQDRVLAASHAAEFEKLLPNSTTKVIPAWTHWPMIETPEEYATEVTKIATDLMTQ